MRVVSDKRKNKNFDPHVHQPSRVPIYSNNLLIINSIVKYTPKVFAYITYDTKLLVFEERGFKDGGIQVPAGTVEEGERPDLAVLREAREETGLEGLELVSYFGETLFDNAVHGIDEIHHRRFYHLRCTTDPPEIWSHEEKDPSVITDDTPEKIILDLYWIDIFKQDIKLQVGHDHFLEQLKEKITGSS